MLNTQVVDPYPEFRNGNHFFDEDDGINLNRANTFPKGYIFIDSNPESDTSNFGRSGWSQNYTRILIHYFVKDKISYTVNDVTYKEKSYANYMARQIKNALEDNVSLGQGYYIDRMKTEDYDGARVLESPKAGFLLYEVVIPVTIKWSRNYG